MKFFSRIGAICLIAALPAYPQSAIIDFEAVQATRVVTANRLTEKITLDGRLEEPAWALALPATDFYQYQPHNGEPSTERTEVRFLYDDDNLYIGFNCYDSNAANMVVNHLQEDFRVSETDGVTVQIDSLHDRHSALIFSTNPAGARRDAQSTDTSTLDDWDGVWDVKVSRTDKGWFAEFVIPFKTLRFSKSPSQEWGVNVTRRIFSKNEETQWSPTPLRYRAANRMSMAGTLKGLEGIHQGRNLKIKPFVIASVTQIRTGTNPRTLKDSDGGFDAKYGLTPSLTLDATYRTDFAQVEVDQQQTNLTRFNLQFPEKRDFFLENATTFAFGDNNNLIPFFSRRIGLSSAGTPIPIVGGMRVSGKAGQYDVGFLGMKTERQAATPSNNYFVGRVKRLLSGNSFIGGIVTSRDSTTAGDYNRVYGADAYFQFFSKLDFNSYLLKSSTPGQSSRDEARKFEAGWRDDDFTIAAAYNEIQPNFNPEVGFVRRRDFTQYSSEASWRPRLEQNKTIRNFNFGATTDYYEGVNGRVETRTQTGTVGVQFQNNGSTSFTVTDTFDRLTSPFAIRPNLSIAAGDYQYLGYSLEYNHNQRSKVTGGATLNWGEFWDGHRKSLSGTASVRPDIHLNVDLNYTRNAVELPNGNFTTNLVGARFTYGFSPRAFLNAYFQYNADAHQVSSNIRFNLTHHPLSDIFVVYNDRRDTGSGELVERALIVKFTNLFNF